MKDFVVILCKRQVQLRPFSIGLKFRSVLFVTGLFDLSVGNAGFVVKKKPSQTMQLGRASEVQSWKGEHRLVEK